MWMREEAHSAELDRKVQHERALRLQELHRNMVMQGGKQQADELGRRMENAAANISAQLFYRNNLGVNVEKKLLLHHQLY